MLWTVVGTGLALSGARWAPRGGGAALLAGIALVLGALKAHLALRHAAARIVDRIRARGDGRCVGGFLSPYTWLFVLLMVLSGRLLRAALPLTWVGLIYLAVGAAMLMGSLRLWAAWYRCSLEPGSD